MHSGLIAALALAMLGLSRPAAADFEALLDQTPVDSCEAYFDQFPEHFWNEFLRGTNFRLLPKNLVPVCYKEASAAGADSVAQFRFATSLQGFGYSDDAIEAMTVCSDAKIPACQTGLGLLLINGLRFSETTGDPLGYREPNRAFELFSEAAAGGSHPAAAYAFLMYVFLEWPREDSVNGVAALAHVHEAAVAQDPMALFVQARFALESFGSSKAAIETAIARLVELNDLGLSGAMFELAEIYETGELVPQDGQKAYEYYLDAAELGNILADARLLQAELHQDAPFEVAPSETVTWGFLFIVAGRASSGHLSLLNYDPDWRKHFAEYLDE
ncbi:MAG: hypothetical protein WD044_16190 [Dongiaceae bacterium]